MTYLYQKKITLTATEEVDKRVVRYSDIDLNGHLNNTKYVEFIVDTHEPEFYRHHKIASIEINYDHEIRGSQEVVLYSNKNNPEVITGKVNGNTHFTSLLTYEHR